MASKPKNSKYALEFIHTLDGLAINKQKEEIERLKAEVERLTAENASVKLGNAELRQMVIERGETAVEDIRVICRLEAEVERLTKAGDAMAEEIALAKRQDEGSRFDPIEMHYDHELIVKWNAAKEGKQSK
jgi:regulator of replication initiation timing